MEVVSPVARSPDFHFNNTTFSPYTTAPSSPTPFGDPFNYQYHYTSAPASPIRGASFFYSDFTAWAYPTPTPRLRNDNDNLFDKGRRNSFASADSTRTGRRASRSLSPSKSTSPSANPVKYCGISRKWPRLKDLLLFRSASEGRATGRGSKDPLQKYTVLPAIPLGNKRAGEDRKTVGGGQTVRRGSGPAVSPHEKHYTANRAAAEEQKRKTPLPFQRHGLLGLVHFNLPVRGKSKANGASSFSKGWI